MSSSPRALVVAGRQRQRPPWSDWPLRHYRSHQGGRSVRPAAPGRPDGEQLSGEGDQGRSRTEPGAGSLGRRRGAVSESPPSASTPISARCSRRCWRLRSRRHLGWPSTHQLLRVFKQTAALHQLAKRLLQLLTPAFSRHQTLCNQLGGHMRKVACWPPPRQPS